MIKKTLILLALAVATQRLPAYAQDNKIDFPQELQDEINVAFSQAATATIVFASQGNISSGNFTSRQDGPDEHYEVYRIPIKYRPEALQGGSVKPFLEGYLGYFHGSAESAPIDGSDEPNDFLRFTTYSVNVGGGADIGLMEGLDFTPAMQFIYSHTRNDFDYNNTASQFFLLPYDKELLNWSANVISYAPSLMLSYHLPVDGITPGISTKYTYIYSNSFSSTSDFVEISSHGSLLQSTVDAEIPLGLCAWDHSLLLRPYIVRTDVYQDVRQALNPLRYFHELGLDLSANVDDSNWIKGIGVGGSYTIGRDFTGWNVALQMRF